MSCEQLSRCDTGETVPASDSDQEQGDYRLDGTLREQEEFMLKEVAAKFGITPEASLSAGGVKPLPRHQIAWWCHGHHSLRDCTFGCARFQ